MKCLTRIYIFCFLRFKNNLCLLICGISVTMVRFMQNRARRVFELTVKLLMFKCFHLLAVMYAFEIFLPVLCSCLNDTPTFTNNILVSIFCLHYPHSLLSLQVCTFVCVFVGCVWENQLWKYQNRDEIWFKQNFPTGILQFIVIKC